jgi:acetoacetate decarboxylase
MASASLYPPAPWRLAGRLVAVAAPIALEVARSLVPAPLQLAPALPGHALTTLVLGLYGEGSTLRYGELAGTVGPVVGAGGPAALVHAIYVDDPRSLTGGRELWGVPKELARFHWRPGAVDVDDATGAPLVSARWREPRIQVPLPAAAPFLGALGGDVRRGRLAGTVRVAPARVALEIASGSPLAALGLAGSRIAAVGRLDVRAHVSRAAPLAARRPPRSAR